jgi:aminoglycoside 3-N-acetyltransferase
MWTHAQLVEDLQHLGVTEGATVLAHTSLRAIGKIEGGGETLVRAFQEALGPSGTLLVPTFNYDYGDPADDRETPRDLEDLERMRALVPAYNADAPAGTARWTGVFPYVVRQQPDACLSAHPMLPFAAIGANAAFLTSSSPFHYPLGSNSPLARLHQIDGQVLLIGVSHAANASIHLAEVWAEAPYIHRSRALKTGPETWTTMRGSPECSEGFARIEPLLRNCRVLRSGYIGNAPSQLMPQRAVVSMAVALLQGDSSALLCQNPDCSHCATARRFTAQQSR